MEGVLASGVLESLTEIVTEKIRLSFSSLPEITCAASLAHHGYLGSLQYMRLWDLDLTSVSAENLASLVSSVTESVSIKKIRDCGLVPILDSGSVESEWLIISSQSLDTDETQALVRAMETGVELVRLEKGVTLDIGGLMEYSGQGKCQEVECHYDTAATYRDKLRRWATSRNWAVISNKSFLSFLSCLSEDEDHFFISRN